MVNYRYYKILNGHDELIDVMVDRCKIVEVTKKEYEEALTVIEAEEEKKYGNHN